MRGKIRFATDWDSDDATLSDEMSDLIETAPDVDVCAASVWEKDRTICWSR